MPENNKNQEPICIPGNRSLDACRTVFSNDEQPQRNDHCKKTCTS